MPASFCVTKKCGEYMQQYSGKRLKIKCFIVGTREVMSPFYTSSRRGKVHRYYSNDCDMSNIAAIIDGREIYLKRKLVFNNVTSFSEHDKSEVTFEAMFTMNKYGAKGRETYFCMLKYPRWIRVKRDH